MSPPVEVEIPQEVMICCHMITLMAHQNVRVTDEDTDDFTTKMAHSTVNVIDPDSELYVRSKGLGKGTDYASNHAVQTLELGHIMKDNLDRAPDTSKGRHLLVVLITDSRHTSYSHHNNEEWIIGSEASVSVTPSREIS